MRKFALLLILSLLWAAPALAQEAVLTYGANTLGSLSAGAPLASFTFNGDEGDLVSIHVIAITPGLDPALSLNSAAQQQLAYADDLSPAATDASLSLSLPETGVFTVIVSSETGAPGDFLLRLSGGPPPPPPPLSNAPLSSSITPGTPQFFSFSAAPVEIITLRVTTTTPGFGFRVTITDSNGAPVAMVIGSDVVGVALPFAPGAAAYTAQVAALDPNLPGQVSVFVSGALPPTPGAPEQTPEAAQPAPEQTAEAAAPAPTSCSISPNASQVNVRSGPATAFDIITQLQPSRALPVTGVSRFWYRVTLPDGGIGWVSDTVVFTSGECRGIPEVEPPPLPTATPSPDQLTPTPTQAG
jgi:hypothetical protein